MIILKTERELTAMRKAGRIVAQALAELEKAVTPGITLKELDQIAENYIVQHGAKPAFKGLYGFPATICASVNEEVVHGIPGSRKLKEGDILGIDIGTLVDGHYGDMARTIPVGKVSKEAQKLIQVTEEALYQGIKQATEGNRLSDVSHAIQSYVEKHGFSVVRDFVGHGIGEKMHESPQIPNFGKPGMGPRLRHGMTLAIEPMVNVGTYEVLTREDGWTVVTRDKSLSAHFEHTVAITPDGPEILTRS